MKLTIALISAFFITITGFAQDAPVTYKVVTVVESIVPGGMGRSRIIETKSETDIESATTERTTRFQKRQAFYGRRCFIRSWQQHLPGWRQSDARL